MNAEIKTEEYPVVRVLTRGDRKKCSALIRAFVERSGNSDLVKMIPGAKVDEEKKVATDSDTDTDTSKMYDLIKSVMEGLIEWVEEELSEWFADLVGAEDIEAYDKMPFDIEIHIIDSLIAQKGFNNFFSRASELYRTIRGLIE